MAGLSIRHVTVTARDLAASLACYDAALGALGLVRVQEFADEEEDPADVSLEAVGYGPVNGEPVLWLVAGDVPTSGLHIALTAATRDAVDAFYAAALGAGGAPRQAPRRWEIYRPGYYGALVADPDGNLVEAVSSE